MISSCSLLRCKKPLLKAVAKVLSEMMGGVLQTLIRQELRQMNILREKKVRFKVFNVQPTSTGDAPVV